MSQHYCLPQEICFLNVGAALCPHLGLVGCNAWLQLATAQGKAGFGLMEATDQDQEDGEKKRQNIVL